MTTSPFEPDPEAGTEYVAASDAGAGAPVPAAGFGIFGEEHSEADDDVDPADDEGEVVPDDEPDDEDER